MPVEGAQCESMEKIMSRDPVPDLLLMFECSFGVFD